MTEFKKGARVVFVKDDRYADDEMPKGTLATYDDDDPINVAPYVLLDTGERVLAWSAYIAHAEDHGTGDGSASDICAVPGCNCDLKRRFPAPLDGIAARRESTPPFEATTNPDGSVTARSNLRFVPDAPQQVEDGLFASANRSLAAALRTGPLTAHTPATEPEPYVPDLKHIRTAYVDARHDSDIITSQEAEAEFDRWMATHVVIDPAEVDVKALSDVYDKAYDDSSHTSFSEDADIKAGLRAVLNALGIEVPR